MFRSHSFWKLLFWKWKHQGETLARGCHLQNCMKEIECWSAEPRSHISKAETWLSRCLSSGAVFPHLHPLFFSTQPSDNHDVPYLQIWQFSLENFKSAFTHIPTPYTKIERKSKNKTNIILHFHLLCLLLSFSPEFLTLGASTSGECYFLGTKQFLQMP